jgi:hypothetical protein
MAGSVTKRHNSHSVARSTSAKCPDGAKTGRADMFATRERSDG